MYSTEPATAIELRGRLGRGEISAVELMQATLEHIERVNPPLNAIVTLAPERALESAREADVRLAKGEPLAPLHGLPIAHKDLVQTAGIRTTFGSKLFEHHVPDEDDLIVQRLRAAGALTLGKTNTPEFGAGSHTFNPVFGVTRNPYDLARSCGGSSGGAAVALAAGLVPIADGSDMGGSLRNPASFCNVVGLRTSPGRVPSYPSELPWSPLSVLGPMARTVADCALLLSAIAGPDARSPIALSERGSTFAPPLDRDFRDVPVAFSPTLGGLPVDRRVLRVVERAPEVLEGLGCRVEATEPDFSGADEIFQVLRAWSFAHRFSGTSPRAFAMLKDTIRWNVERGRALSGADVARAEARRGQLYQRVRTFMERYAFLIAPVSQVPPFDLELDWVREIEGVEMETYIDWMRSCSYITLTGHPAISVPFGFTDDGLPVGLQIVGRHHDERGVLELAHAVEQATRAVDRRPPEPDQRG